MKFNKKLTILILLILVAITASTSFYVFQKPPMETKINEQSRSFNSNLIGSDQNTLNKFINTLYPLFKSLDGSIKNVIYNTSNSELYNLSLTNINKAKLIDNGNKGANDPYGLPVGIDDKKRLILDQILDQFKQKNPGVELVYSFIATEDCNMYLMEPLDKQKQLKSGVYPDHPLCVEFYDKKDRSAEYLTEFYYAKSALVKVSSILFPLQSKNGNTSFYVGGTLDLFNFTREFFVQNNLPEWPHAQILLLVKYDKDAKKELFDPQTTDPTGIEHIGNISIQKFKNSSFTKEDQDIMIKNIESFDNSDNGQGKIVSTNDGMYMITATSNFSPDPYHISNPIENHAHQVQWEWILIRSVPDIQTTINTLFSTIDYYKFLTLIIYPLFVLSIIGIGATLILLRLVSKEAAVI